jgi:hypothetical protein
MKEKHGLIFHLLAVIKHTGNRFGALPKQILTHNHERHARRPHIFLTARLNQPNVIDINMAIKNV